MDNPDVLVIGAGVCGLSAALAVARSGRTVTVYAASQPSRTTSAAAGALWGPHLVGADERVGGWAVATLTRLRELAGHPASGVREMAGLAAATAGLAAPTAGTAAPEHADRVPNAPGDRHPMEDLPDFARQVGDLTRCDPGSLPVGYASGWRYTAPVVSMPVYLDYLLDEILQAGGQLHLGKPLTSLAEALQACTAPVVVNCTGIGARTLVPDPDLIPVRGQVVLVANPGLTEWFVGEQDDPAEVTYFFPHGTTAVLGGTQSHGDSSTIPDPATAARIVRACAKVEPALAEAPVLGHRVGLRPVRPRVRLEVTALGDGRHLVHNYGHGGAGVSLSWGCALEVAEQVRMVDIQRSPII
ncbi:MAG TPA: FAD-dependent oxidoreductase [Streptosporangiaceae bacterium]|nr:FAD-dependent oxidoreductase [Streptosporangiaceae bacterium]